MYPEDSKSIKSAENLRVLDAALDAPEHAYKNDAEVRDAFDTELRELAEEIVQSHPSLTQLLLAMGKPEMNPVHGKN